MNNVPINLLHLGSRAFDEIGGEVVQTAAYVIEKAEINNYRGTYARLVDGLDQTEKEKMFLNIEGIYTSSVENFSKTDEKILSYWLSEQYYHIYENKKIENIAYTFQGIITGKTEKYLRLWFEPEYSKIVFNETNINSLISSNCYYPYIKGGSFRRWYGNLDYVIHWEKNGSEFVRSRTENRSYFFPKGVSWSDLCTGKFSCRYIEQGFLFDASGPMLFANNVIDINMICGYFNSKVFQSLLDINSQGLHYGNGAIASQPVIMDNNRIEDLVKSCIEISKADWNQNETSWDFKKNPIVVELENMQKNNGAKGTIKEAFDLWKIKCEKRFTDLKRNEEEINKVIIELYGLSDELDEKISDSEISVMRADYERDIKNFISYAIGCMFGRYSLNNDGLCYAGGNWDSSYYLDYIPDEDGIISISDEQYFKNDIVELLISFINIVSDEKYLEENLFFIANALNENPNPPAMLGRTE